MRPVARSRSRAVLLTGPALLLLAALQSPAAASVAGPQPVADAFEASLSSDEGAPDLRVDEVRLLQRTVKKLDLVRGSWTRLEVDVSNAETASGDAEQLVVTGSGKGLKVQSSEPLTYGLTPGASMDAYVFVKLTGKKSGPLTVEARSLSGTASRQLAVKSVKAPKAPQSGRYAARKEGVSFQLKGRKVVGFRVGPVATRCGGFPNPFTTHQATYTFPATRVLGSGLVGANERFNEGEAAEYVVDLEMKVVGGKATQGFFTYYGPDRCYASVAFKARRSGR